jgi:hypothetical protein
VRQLDGGHLLDTQQLCGRHPAVAGNDLVLVVDEHGIAEAKPLDALSDLANLLVGVCARVARIRSKRFDRERFDLHIASYLFEASVLDPWCEFKHRDPAAAPHGSAFAQSKDCA